MPDPKKLMKKQIQEDPGSKYDPSKDYEGPELRDFTGDPTTKGTHFEKPVNLTKSSGLGPRSSFGGVNNPELTKTKENPHKKVFKDGPKNKMHQSKPTQYAPFKMAAADYGNSPIEKNFGPAKLRGFNTGGLIGGVQGKTQAKTGVGSSLNMGAAVGSSPNKFWKKMKKKARKMLGMDKVADVIKNVTGMGGDDPAEAEAGGIAEAGAAQAVPMHGEESHTGGAGPVGGGGKQIAGAGDAASMMMGQFAQAQQAQRAKEKNVLGGGNTMWGGIGDMASRAMV